MEFAYKDVLNMVTADGSEALELYLRNDGYSDSMAAARNKYYANACAVDLFKFLRSIY